MKIAAILPEEKVVVDEEPEAKRAKAWDVDGRKDELLLTTLDVMNQNLLRRNLISVAIKFLAIGEKVINLRIQR